MTNLARPVPPMGNPWTLSSAMLVLAGMIIAGIGLYFIVLRPSLLPEDIRYMRLSSAELEAIGPRLASWLTYVFRVLGGYALATGALLIALAATAFRTRLPAAVAGALVGGASSIGLMAVVNFMIDSDFKWALLAGALVWALSLVVFWFESDGSADAPQKATSGRSPTHEPADTISDRSSGRVRTPTRVRAKAERVLDFESGDRRGYCHRLYHMATGMMSTFAYRA